MLSTIHVFSCKAEPTDQYEAFSEGLDSGEVVGRSFLARPSAKVGRGAVWHIGNASEMHKPHRAVSFALGREAVVKAQRFDESVKEFSEFEDIQSPFTIGVYDFDTQCTGVVVKQGVSLNAREVGAKIQTLLEKTGFARSNGRRIVVDYLPNSETFIEALLKAHRIRRFEFEFSPPNPPRMDDLIQEPLKRFALEAGASEGRTIIKGEHLNMDALVALTHAVAATGEEAKASIVEKEGGPTIKKSLSTNALKEPVYGSLVEESAAETVLRATRRAYERVRHWAL